MKQGAVRFRAEVQAESVERAVRLATARYPGGAVRVLLPIDPVAFFIEQSVLAPQSLKNAEGYLAEGTFAATTGAIEAHSGSGALATITLSLESSEERAPKRYLTVGTLDAIKYRNPKFSSRCPPYGPTI